MYNYLNFKVFDLRMFPTVLQELIMGAIQQNFLLVVQNKFVLLDNIGDEGSNNLEEFLLNNGGNFGEMVLIQFAGFDQTITPKSNSNKNILKNTRVEAKSFHIGDITIANFS